MTNPGPEDPAGATAPEPSMAETPQLTDAGALEEDGSGRDQPHQDLGDQALREAEQQSGLAGEPDAPYDESAGRSESAGR